MSSRAKQLASLTAAGAGAIALTAGKAEASGIIVSSVLNTAIAFSSDTATHSSVFATHIFNNLASGPNFEIRLRTQASEGSVARYATILKGTHNTFFDVRNQGLEHAVVPFANGVTWSADSNRASQAWIGLRVMSPDASTFGQPGFSDQYLLFQFSGNGGPKYGWIELSMSVTNTTDQAASNGPNVNVVQYGFDSSGAVIAAGDGGTPTPEPSSLAESGLAALILGAEGLRRRRKSAQAA